METIPENEAIFGKSGYTPKAKLQSLILCGGRGTRLKAERKLIDARSFPFLQEFWDQEGPKSLALLTINGKTRPLFDWHLDLHAATPQIEQVSFALGCQASTIQAYCRYIYNSAFKGRLMGFWVEQRPAGTIAALVKMHKAGVLPQTPLLIANGDNILQADFYQAYLRGTAIALFNGIAPEETVIDLASRVPYEQSGAYGVLNICPKTGLAKEFYEKRPYQQNPFEELDGIKISRINSGFSIMPNPSRLLKPYITKELQELVEALENGETGYKEHEAAVKYETLYEKLAADGRVAAVKENGYWADSGSEKQIEEIEKHYRPAAK